MQQAGFTHPTASSHAARACCSAHNRQLQCPAQAATLTSTALGVSTKLGGGVELSLRPPSTVCRGAPAQRIASATSSSSSCRRLRVLVHLH